MIPTTIINSINVKPAAYPQRLRNVPMDRPCTVWNLREAPENCIEEVPTAFASSL
ncbi:hypothetical protein GCM10010981_29400 [Dyella nitratireducens]|uniref:Uncharacterized protein n=1 Tax=Dyella nitratireducens TaxID=1849580 RepID=A0ABQ1G7Y5_9GAMM|nr:hypothetical protein GCM10010981_29400 [Dyella nitratireducens]GLQ40297.1 hypothetical protein GCM10007902_01460 [Dyella nitratireducens]